MLQRTYDARWAGADEAACPKTLVSALVDTPPWCPNLHLCHALICSKEGWINALQEGGCPPWQDYKTTQMVQVWPAYALGCWLVTRTQLTKTWSDEDDMV